MDEDMATVSGNDAGGAAADESGAGESSAEQQYQGNEASDDGAAAVDGTGERLDAVEARLEGFEAALQEQAEAGQQAQDILRQIDADLDSLSAGLLMSGCVTLILEISISGVRFSNLNFSITFAKLMLAISTSISALLFYFRRVCGGQRTDTNLAVAELRFHLFCLFYHTEVRFAITGRR